MRFKQQLTFFRHIPKVHILKVLSEGKVDLYDIVLLSSPLENWKGGQYGYMEVRMQPCDGFASPYVQIIG